MSQKRKQSNFSDDSPEDIVTMLYTMADEMRQAGHNIEIAHGLVSGKNGIVIFMPDVQISDRGQVELFGVYAHGNGK